MLPFLLDDRVKAMKELKTLDLIQWPGLASSLLHPSLDCQRKMHCPVTLDLWCQ